MQNQAQPPAWSTQTKWIVIFVIMVGVGFFLYKFSEALPPLVMAIILAYILSPLVNRLENRLKVHRVVATLMIYLVLALVITGLLMIVIPPLTHQVRGLARNITGFIINSEQYFSGQFDIAGFTILGEEVPARVASSLQSMLSPLFTQTIDVVAAILAGLVWLIFIVVISIYLIKDSPEISTWIESLTPPAYRADVVRIRRELNVIWSAFFRGQLLLSLTVTGIRTTEAFAIGLPFPVALGLLAGVLEFFPSVGHGIWLVIAGLLAVIRGSTWLPVPYWAFLLILLGTHTIFTQFDLNYLIPRIIGRSVRLSPMVIILGIVAGAALAGVLGIVLAAPSIASLRVLGRYVYARLMDMDPFPDDTSVPRLPPPNARWWRRHPAASRQPQNESMDETVGT
jgi:predicted PurR-regulated permease PerM